MLARSATAVRVLPFYRTLSSVAGDVRSAHRFDEEALRAHLAANIPGDDFSSITVEQFKHGQSNPTYPVASASGRKYVVRKQPPGRLLKGAHAVDREYKIMSALQGHLPVPNTHLFCENPEIIGTPFFVYDFVPGRLLADGLLPEVPLAERAAHYSSMAKTLATMHSINPNDIGLESFGGGSPTEFIPRQIKVWSKQYQAAQTQEIPEMDKLMEWLPQNVPTRDVPVSIAHGDFRIDNMIYSQDSSDVAAVLDWELSTIGHPLSDLAYNCIVYHMPSFKGSPVSGFTDKDISALGIPSEEAYLAEYAKHFVPSSTFPAFSLGDNGLPENWNFFLSFSFFRIAAILQGVFARAQAGSASAANALQVGALAKDMARIGWHHAQLHSATPARIVRGTSTGWTDESVRNLRNETVSVPRSSISSATWPVPSFPPPSEKAVETLGRVRDFMNEKVLPAEADILNHQYTSAQQWTHHHPRFVELKQEARDLGLWNMFMPTISDPEHKWGAGFTNLEYAAIAEETGRSIMAPELFNCSAPDTGNMEVLAMFGSEEQQAQYLTPLLEGSVRSCFAMTEPAVASSDATNMAATIEEDGDDVIINGRKWWISGAMDPHCTFSIFMGRSVDQIRDGAPRHQQHSMVLVPLDTPGVEIHRPMSVFGYADAPHGHADMTYHNVRVPKSNVILGAGRGFEIAQGRLGPGRIHHCMRLIGASERALDLMIHRTNTRTAFGKPLINQGTILRDIALSRTEIDMARLLTLQAAHTMDAKGNKEAKDQIAAIKIVAPRVASDVVDRSMQAHGAAGLSQDTPLGHMYAWARILRLADGPDEVHIAALGKSESRRS